VNDWALVIIDCLRHDHAGVFNFPGTRRLDHVMSVGNWTLPAVTTMVTGLHPFEHRAGCEPVDGNVVNSMKSWPSTLRGCEKPTIIDADTVVLYEIPVLAIAVRPPRLGYWKRCNKDRKAHEQAWDHLDAERLVIHLKGGHSPWRYVGIPNSEIDYDDRTLYRLELEALAKELEPLVAVLLERYFDVVVVADHGRFFENYTHGNHGCEFGLEVLHVPLWYKERRWTRPVPDELYDLRAVYDLLLGRMPTSRQVAFSTSPGHGTYNRIAASYLTGGELRCDVFETSEPFDLEA